MSSPSDFRSKVQFMLARALLLGILTFGSFESASASSLYTVTALPTGFVPSDINDSGAIVGTAINGFDTEGFLYQNGTLTAQLIPAARFSGAISINNNGEIAGFVADTFFTNPATFQNGVEVTLGPGSQFPNQGYAGLANDVNESGVVAGWLSPSIGPAGAAIWTPDGQPRVIVPSVLEEAVAINNKGLVVGQGMQGSGFAFAYDLNGNGDVVNLGGLGGGSTGVAGVNDSGAIVGSSTLANADTHAFIYSNGALHDLGTLGGANSQAGAINNEGQIVGFADTASGNQHAFVDSDGSLIDLNTLVEGDGSVVLTDAAGINNRGQIIATGSDGNPYLLTPLSEAPEPATTAMMVGGLIALVVLKPFSKRRLNR